MAAYNGPRAPIVSQYLRNLNVQDAAMDDVTLSEEDLQKELAIFTNTQFYDFDSGQNTDYQAHPAKATTKSTVVAAAPEPQSATTATSDESASPDAYMTDFSNLDFLSSDFNFGEFGPSYASPTGPSFPDQLGGLQPTQTQSQQAYTGPAVHSRQAGYPGPPAPLVPSAKSKAEPSPDNVVAYEEQSRRLAEEDKRRRNTAASARFRIKKKQREQALEKSAKEMMDKVNQLESQISSLETENKWLRRIVMDKHGKDELPVLLKALRARPAAEKETGAKSKGLPSSSKAGDEGGEDSDDGAEDDDGDEGAKN